MGKGGRQEDFPTPQHSSDPPASRSPPSAPHQHLLVHPSTPTRGEDEEGYPQIPDPAEGMPRVGLSPEHPKPSLGATVPAQRCREPPVTHTSHPPSGCLRGITQLLPSALIQGLNIPGPGIKIGTIWEGPESAASAAGTHRHPPRHARHPPGSPRAPPAPGGFAGFGDTHREGEPPKSCVYPGATLVPAGANSQALRRCSVSPRGAAVPKGGW